MRKIFLTAVIIVPLFSLAQFGIKAGSILQMLPTLLRLTAAAKVVSWPGYF
jgi:hypothetical protein